MRTLPPAAWAAIHARFAEATKDLKGLLRAVLNMFFAGLFLLFARLGCFVRLFAPFACLFGWLVVWFL